MRIADLFCGAGGAGMGLHRAGFEVVGFDINRQSNYPFEFHQQDALTVDLNGFDAVWASPPCQAFSQMQHANPGASSRHADLIKPTRAKLLDSGLPFIIENVPGAPLIDPVTLCGLAFGLRVLRHRLFEASFPQFSLRHQTHPRQPKIAGRTSAAHLASLAYVGFTTGSNISAFRDAMDCGWMTVTEARQAIPPAYSEYLGLRLIEQMETP